MTTTVPPINYHNVPISDRVKEWLHEWTEDYLTDGDVFDMTREEYFLEQLRKCISPYDVSMVTHMMTTVNVIYGDGIYYDGESWTPGLDGSDDGKFEQHVHMEVVNSMQRHVHELKRLVDMQRPNRLFGVDASNPT